VLVDNPCNIGDAASGPGTTLSVEIINLRKGDSVPSGKKAHYRAVIRNTGSLTAGGVRVDAAWTRLRTFGQNVGEYYELSSGDGSCSPTSCPLGDLSPGAERRVEFRGDTEKGALTRYRLTAIAEADNAPRVSTATIIGASVTVLSSEGGAGSSGIFLPLLLMLAARR
jgi:hypothetical protein